MPVLLLFSVVVFAQTKTVTGRVTDATGKAVSGASVIIKGQARGVMTSEDGTYSIPVPANATSIIVSSVGFTPQEISIAGKTTVDATLQSTAANMNEVVVVAYGTRRRGDLTASVTSISAKDFQKGQVSSSEQLLQGKVAGLQVTSGGGSAGGGSRIRIRGGASLNASNDPLVVIDGVPTEGNSIAGSSNVLNTINPNDIESISVLKDASATALYGSRASNGVLIITTKKGAAGKLRFNFNTRASVGIIGKKVAVLTGDQVRAIINADAVATGNNTYKALLGTANTDWQDQIYQKAFGSDNNLSAAGTYANVPYRISLGYLSQDGILKTDHFNRVTSTLNLSPKFFTNHLTANIAAKFSRTGNRFADGGAVGNAINYDPTQPVYTKNRFGGYYEWLQPNGLPIDLSNRNPLALLELRDNRSNVNRFIGNVQLDYKLHFLPDLHVLLNLGMDRIHGEGHDFQDSAMATVYKTGGRRVPFYQQTQTNTLADISLTYAKELPALKSKFDALLLHSYQDFTTDVYNYPAFSYRAIADPNKPGKKDTIQGSEPTFATDKPQFRLESYLARVNLTVYNNFLLTGSLRRDASSRFAPENRVGYFPAAAVAVKLRELVFGNVRPISDLKLRFSWGQTGQQNTGSDYYGYLPRYARSTGTAQYQFGNNFYSFLRPGAYDRDRRWESTTTTNLGLDFGFFGNRISGSVDLYKKKTKDLLSVVPVAPGTNFDIQLLTNVGNMENRGVEFTLNTNVVRNRNFSWDLNFNATVNETKITNLLQYPDPSFKGIDVSGIGGGTGNKIGKYIVGEAPYSFFVFKQIYDRLGKPIEGLYEDVNRDGVVDDNDRYLYKKPAPDALIGASTQFTYKKLTLSAAGHASLGNYLYNNYFSNAGVLNSIKNPLNFIGNATVNYLESGFLNNRYLTDYYIENASFFRLDHISVDYNLGRVTKNLSGVRIGASVQNVFVVTKYKGLDPENSNDTGTDNNIYPRPRTYSLSVNLDF
ncbi:SusC/RagA family TonB-linked outer membrane protein [Flavisolibacter nicotianae]|uniref:SusC/RagA family TonB-linked outer membrane protein n=1 Tax=Flavisolibacter nicotianae TaxID=2364882 RepID=UPI0013C4F629|nr:SusC/RagA family TonB-linked outer membrane protein [Flavisolibacter nicotianae]